MPDRRRVVGQFDAIFLDYSRRMDTVNDGCGFGCLALLVLGVAVPLGLYRLADMDLGGALGGGAVIWVLIAGFITMIHQIWEKSVVNPAMRSFNETFDFGTEERDIALNELRRRVQGSAPGASELSTALGLADEDGVPEEPAEEQIQSAIADLDAQLGPAPHPPPSAPHTPSRAADPRDTFPNKRVKRLQHIPLQPLEEDEHD